MQQGHAQLYLVPQHPTFGFAAFQTPVVHVPRTGSQDMHVCLCSCLSMCVVFFLYSAAVNFGQVVFRMDLLVIKKHMNDYQ